MPADYRQGCFYTVCALFGKTCTRFFGGRTTFKIIVDIVRHYSGCKRPLTAHQVVFRFAYIFGKQEVYAVYPYISACFMVVRRYSKHFHTSFVFVAFFVNLVKHNRKGNASVRTYVFKSHIKTEYTSRGLRIYVLQIIICSVLAAAYGYGNGFGTCVGGIYNASSRH